ncbi:MAG: hypothetical protein LBB41_08020 [Prevotellaceae bacterium]|nr:hypothetical protein [Prevotellaceae bacterium]
MRLTFLYQNTLKEAGKHLASNAIEWNDNYWRNIVALKFEHATEYKAKLTWQPFRTLQLQAELLIKRYRTA